MLILLNPCKNWILVERARKKKNFTKWFKFTPGNYAYVGQEQINFGGKKKNQGNSRCLIMLAKFVNFGYWIMHFVNFLLSVDNVPCSIYIFTTGPEYIFVSVVLVDHFPLC